MDKTITSNKRKKNNERKAIFNKKLSTDTNNIMAIFNFRTYGLRLNNNILINIAVKRYVNYVKSMTLKDALLFLKKDVMDYLKGEDYE